MSTPHRSAGLSTGRRPGWIPGSSRSRVWIITSIYTGISVLWIYFSDQALATLAGDTETFTRWSVYKGVAFVIVTSLLLLLLISRAYGALEKAYAELRELNASLEQRVADRTRELSAAVTRAESADRIKSAFLATMSHELRTPLNSIIGFTGIVVQGLAGPLTEEQSKQLSMVRNSARHLLDLINDVLDLSKIEADQLPLKPETFNVAESVQHVVASVAPLAEKKQVELTMHIADDIHTMHTDRRRVQQILLNLLNNALKFTDHGRITVTAELEPAFSLNDQKDPVPAARFSVCDTGIGIRNDDLGSLFQPFRQVDNGLTRQYDGSGLGLAICRRLATLLGGTITVQSVWSEGSEFTVVLPLELK
jgi:signal transduction histidine kinase